MSSIKFFHHSGTNFLFHLPLSPPNPGNPVKHAHHIHPAKSKSPVREALRRIPRRSAHKKVDQSGAVDVGIISILHAPLQKLGAAPSRNGGCKRGPGGRSDNRTAPQHSGCDGNIHAGGRKLRLDPAVQGKSPSGIHVEAVVSAVIGGYSQNILCIGRRGQG